MFRVIKLKFKCYNGSLLCRFSKSFMAMGCRKFSIANDSAQCLVYQKLAARSLIRVAGKDSSLFLQGLITNDMNHFEDDKKDSMYAMMLNQTGRVLYDVIVYAQRVKNGELSYLMECDSTVSTDICKHLKLYRVRKKIDIVPMEGQLCVWSLFKHPKLLQLEEIAAPENPDVPHGTSHQPPEHSGKVDDINISIKMDSDQVHAHTKDPRLASLGWRIVLSEGTVPKDIVVNHNVVPAEDECYRTLRYRLGIGEGVGDLPPANCLPLECNLDYLHGVSFHKGCYVGQELTARVHHTGVVRKRLLPMVLEETGSNSEFDLKTSSVVNEDGKSVGKFLGHRGNVGLGLLRIQECIHSKKKLRLQDLQSSVGFITFKPFWWPLEAPRESPSATKNV